jgi:hypothetical protein
VGKFYEGVGESLTPYVRSIAWWWAVPEPVERKHRRISDAPDQPVKRQSRLKALKKGEEPFMPAFPEEFGFLVDILFEVGPTSTGGMSVTQLSWADLGAWENQTGYPLQPWQSRLLRNLSAEFLSESHRATDPVAHPPWHVDMTPERRAAVAKHIRALLRS